MRASDDETDILEGERGWNDGRGRETDGVAGDDVRGTDLFVQYDGAGGGNSDGMKVCSSCTALLKLCTEPAAASHIRMFGRVMVASV